MRQQMGPEKNLDLFFDDPDGGQKLARRVDARVDGDVDSETVEKAYFRTLNKTYLPDGISALLAPSVQDLGVDQDRVQEVTVDDLRSGDQIILRFGFGWSVHEPYAYAVGYYLGKSPTSDDPRHFNVEVGDHVLKHLRVDDHLYARVRRE